MSKMKYCLVLPLSKAKFKFHNQFNKCHREFCFRSAHSGKDSPSFDRGKFKDFIHRICSAKMYHQYLGSRVFTALKPLSDNYL